MKTLKKTLPILFVIISILFIGTSCDNDANPSPNDQQCNYNGITFVDDANDINTAIPDSDLTTTFYPNANGGAGRLEIRETANPNDTFLITDVVTDGATGTGIIRFMGTDYPQPIIITCQRAGNAVGDDFRLDIVVPAINTDSGQVIEGQTAEFEYCGKIDMVDDNQYSCDDEGLYYSVDGGAEVYLPSTHDNVNTNFLENNNANLTVHQLANGFFFFSKATTEGQTSDHDRDLANGTSELSIFSLWSYANTVTILYTCQRNDEQIWGTVYYTFTGSYIDDQNNSHTIDGHLCVLLDEIRP
jgi:hypothetical protein